MRRRQGNDIPEIFERNRLAGIPDVISSKINDALLELFNDHNNRVLLNGVLDDIFVLIRRELKQAPECDPE